MSDLRKQFVEIANDRLRRATGALGKDPVLVYQELHSLAGEAGILGFTQIWNVTNSALEITRAWRTTAPTSEQQLACARMLRSLRGLVEALAQEVARPRRAPTATGRRALVIDDSELVTEELSAALHDAGFDVSSATTVEHVVSSVQATPPDVVLVDANMPGVDLQSLCKRIRENVGTTKLLVVSASNDDELHDVAQQVGADGYVSKLRGMATIIGRAEAVLGGQ